MPCTRTAPTPVMRTVASAAALTPFKATATFVAATLIVPSFASAEPVNRTTCSHRFVGALFVTVNAAPPGAAKLNGP